MLGTLGASPSPPEPVQAARTTPPAIREEVRREMLQLKGTWSSMQTLESTVNGVPQKPKQFKMIWSIDRDTITDCDEDGFAARTYRYTSTPKSSRRRSTSRCSTPASSCMESTSSTGIP